MWCRRQQGTLRTDTVVGVPERSDTKMGFRGQEGGEGSDGAEHLQGTSRRPAPGRQWTHTQHRITTFSHVWKEAERLGD